MNQKPSTQQVKNPSLTLYAFHLRHSLSEGSEQVTDKAYHLWEQFVKLGEQLNIGELKSLKSKLLCYEDTTGTYKPSLEEKALEDKHSSLPLELLKHQRTLEFHVPTQPNSPQLSGEIYPIRIHDTYAVDLTLRYEEPVDITQLSQLNPNGYLLSSWIRPSLGETFLLFAEPPNNTNDYQTLANACVKEVLSTTNQPLKDYIAQGKLFGSPIFEYDNQQEDPTQRCHLWVWFNTDNETLKSIGETADYVLNLLCCRSKILFAYHQARLCYWQARQLYSRIETQVQIFNNLPTDSGQRLEKLKILLTNISPIAFQYARLLRDMHDHTQSIVTNTENYSIWLQKISQKSQDKYSDDNLKFLENFRDRTNPRLQQQIQTDINYLSPGQDMFQQAIAASRGLVEIDQAERDRQRQEELRQQEEREEKKRERLEKSEKERDRNFQTTAFAVASGLAVGGIVISASSQVTKENPIRMPGSPTASSPHPFILWVLGSIVSGLVAAWLVWWIAKRRQKQSKEKSAEINLTM